MILTFLWGVFAFNGLLISLISGQATDVNPETCTYSFIVPQTDLVTTCKKFSSQQVQALENKIDDLEEKLRQLASSSRTSTDVSRLLNTTIPNPRFSCSCHNETSFNFAYTDCQDVKTILNGRSGTYEITPVRETGQLIAVEEKGQPTNHRYWVTTTWDPFKVYCDLGGEIGWTVIMRRKQMTENFNRTWNEYKKGFGNLADDGDFWLGLDKMHQITSQKYASFSMWILVTTDMDVPHVAAYTTFSVASEEVGYMLTVNGFHGRSGSDFFSKADGRFFTAWDKDGNTTEWRRQTTFQQKVYNRYTSSYYRAPTECVLDGGETAGGGWWFYDHISKYVSAYSADRNCGEINLNALEPFMSGFKRLKSVEMKIRPTQ